MKKLILAFAFILLFGFVSAACNSSQINVNTASKKDLDALYGVGEAKAQAIIDARPYNSVDELVNAKGIGPATLEKIKEQGLACVDTNSKINKTENVTNSSKENSSNFSEINNSSPKESSPPPTNPKSDQIVFVPTAKVVKEKSNLSVPVTLTPKDIKTQNSLQNTGKTDYSKYAFLLFCVILLGLYGLKFRKRKNEWKK